MTDQEREALEALGRRLRASREAKEWSLARLAEESSLTKAYIVRVEKGASNISLRVVGQLAVALSVSPAWLAFGVER